MTPAVWSRLKVRLQTMDGFPSWTAANDALLSEDYFVDLTDVPDAIGERMIPELKKRYGSRPNTKQLREWAAELAQAMPSNLRRLTGQEPLDPYGDPENPARPDYRPGQARLSAPEGGVSLFAAKVLPPAAAREIIARLKAKGGVTSSGAAEYGLQFEVLEGYKGAGRVNRTGTSYTKLAAEQAAEERNAKWPHQRTTVFHQADPLPTPRRQFAGRDAIALGTEAQSTPVAAPEDETKLYDGRQSYWDSVLSD